MALGAMGTEVVQIATGVHPRDVISHGAAIYARRAEETKDEVYTSDCRHSLDAENYAENERMGTKSFTE
jgi:hypothetical protein